MMDHMRQRPSESGKGGPDMMYLTKPRGRGYSLRMSTPDVLVGTLNPWTGKPFGREIKLGLNTTRHAEAIRLRDVRLGQIRQLEAEAIAAAGKKPIGRIIDLTPESAAEWREMRAEAQDAYELDYILTNELDKAERAGLEREARAFAKMVFEGAMPIEEALERYLNERSEGNPFGYDPLAKTTAQNLRSSVRHLLQSMGQEKPLLQDVTPAVVERFTSEYLPHKAKVSYSTISKHMTLLRGMWSWAITDKKLLRTKTGKLIANPWAQQERGTPRKRSRKSNPEEARTAFNADQISKLFAGFSGWGTRQGDLMRLALVTGCRVDELGSLLLADVVSGGEGFFVRHGKTENAKRFVPVVEDAQRLLGRRVEKAIELQTALPVEKHRLFPEWPLKPSTNKVNAVSQWFTRYRREVLGKETDGRLAMHSFRHTWRTTARRAGVPEDRINELGGWSQEQNTSWVYDHGLTHQQLTEAQASIWKELRSEGYLSAF